MPFNLLPRSRFSDDVKSLTVDRRALRKNFSSDLISWSTFGEVAEIPGHSDYQNLARYYLTTALLFAAMKAVTDSLTGAMLVVEERAKNGTWGIADEHAFNRFIEKPNPEMSQMDLLHAWYVHLTIFGVIRSVLIGGKQQEFMPYEEGARLNFPTAPTNNRVLFATPVQPGLMQPRHVKEGNVQTGVLGFRYTLNDIEYWVPAGDVMVDLIYSPEAYGIGVSPVRTLSRVLNLSDSLYRYIERHFLNGGIPSGIVRVKYDATREEPPTEEDLDLMSNRWTKRFAMGGKREGEVAFVSGDLEFERLSDKLNELISVDLFDVVESQVTAVTGVPPQIYLVGMRHGSVRANAKEANEAFFKQTVWPLLERQRVKIERVIFPGYVQEKDRKKFRLAWDLTECPIAASRETDRRTMILKEWELNLLTRNETRNLLNREALSGEDGNEFFSDTQQIEVTETASDGSSTKTTRRGSTPVRRNSSNTTTAAAAN